MHVMLYVYYLGEAIKRSLMYIHVVFALYTNYDVEEWLLNVFVCIELSNIYLFMIRRAWIFWIFF